MVPDIVTNEDQKFEEFSKFLKIFDIMALLIDSIDKCKQLKDLSKYTVFFFYTPEKMNVADFRRAFGPLLKKVRTNREFKCGQFSKDKVEIPREAFGFESDYGAIFYRDGVYLTYMCDFNPNEFERIVNNIDKEPLASIGNIRTVAVNDNRADKNSNFNVTVNIY
ncbi:hypothetical protein GGI23_002089 [Coemansia sp. RSA 2559]|nr:hypothetical protein GGI23_002089 [Coemansia sp. RSA 2559]